MNDDAGGRGGSMRHLYLIAVASVATMPATTQAQVKLGWNPDIASVPVARCTVQEVTSRIKYEGIAGAANVANGQIPAIRELERLSSKATDEKRSVGEQLSAADNARFGELTQRLKTGQLGNYVESRRQRDADVLQRLVEIADREYRFGPQTEGNERDATLGGVLIAMRQHAQDQRDWEKQIDPELPGVCSLPVAIKKLADEAFQKLNAMDTDGPTTALQIMADRYGMKGIDPAKLTPADRAEYVRIRAEMAAPIAGYNYVTDLRNIVWLSDAMNLNYRAMRQDIVAGGGAVDHIGKTIDKMVADGQIDAPTQMAFRALKIINDKIPAPAVDEWSQIGKPAN